MATLAERLEISPKPGEIELTGMRTPTGKTFRDASSNRFRCVTVVGPIHWRHPFTSEAWDDRDLDVVLTPAEPWDAACDRNGLQLRFWRQRGNHLYPVQIRRGGRWIGMAPIGLWWTNDANERELVGRPSLQPEQIDNDKNFVRVPNCFGPGLDWGYNLSGATHIFKFLRIRRKSDIPAPTIGLGGLSLTLVIALGWDPELSADNGFGSGQDVSALPDQEDWSTPDESIDGSDDFGMSDVRGLLMRIKRPRAWDSFSSHDPPGGAHTMPLNWQLRRKGGSIYAILTISARALNDPACVYPVFLDTDVDEQIAGGGDDGWVDHVGNTFDNNDNEEWVGNWANSGRYDTWLRFTTVAIPNGATIDTADIELKADSSYSGATCKATIQGNDVDDAGVVTSYAEYDALVWTTASVAWNPVPATTAGTWYDTPDISTVVKEIVDRGGWVSGQDMAFNVANDVSSINAYRDWCQHDKAAADAAKLDVTYTAVGAFVPYPFSRGARGGHHALTGGLA